MFLGFAAASRQERDARIFVVNHLKQIFLVSSCVWGMVSSACWRWYCVVVGFATKLPGSSCLCVLWLVIKGQVGLVR